MTMPLEPGRARELETAHRRLIDLHLEKELSRPGPAPAALKQI